MNTERYDRRVSLLCSTCGNDQFEFDQGVDDSLEIAKCASCGREIDKDNLIRENSENINAHVEEIGQQIVKDVANDLRSRLKKAFQGNKNIKFR